MPTIYNNRSRGQAPQATSSSEPSSAQQQSMMENMQKMQEQMAKIGVPAVLEQKTTIFWK